MQQGCIILCILCVSTTLCGCYYLHIFIKQQQLNLLPKSCNGHNMKINCSFFCYSQLVSWWITHASSFWPYKYSSHIFNVVHHRYGLIKNYNVSTGVFTDSLETSSSLKKLGENIKSIQLIFKHSGTIYVQLTFWMEQNFAISKNAKCMKANALNTRNQVVYLPST